MKRFGVLLLALVMALAVVAAAGCGSESKDKAAAKEHMNAGDDFYAQGAAAYDEMQKLMPKLMTASADQLPDLLASLTAQGQKVESFMAQAKTEYEKILPLTDVEDYVAYAGMQVSVIAKYASLLEAGNAMLEKYLPEIQAGTVDLTALLAGPEYLNIQKIDKEIEAQDQENREFKSQKKLGG